jgi:hypothetical protein
MRSPEKTIVTWENIQSVAKAVIRAARRHFGPRLLSFSDSYLENTIHPWMDNYIHENYLLPGSPSKATLDDFILIELRNGN